MRAEPLPRELPGIRYILCREGSCSLYIRIAVYSGTTAAVLPYRVPGTRYVRQYIILCCEDVMADVHVALLVVDCECN